MKSEDLKVRLIKLIDEGKRAYCSICPNCDKNNCEECENARIADHLINNDVTIRERGKWKTVADHKISVITECSACEKQFYFMKKGQLNIDRMPFCPNCGADMRGEKE